MKTHHSGSEHRPHRRHQAALLAIALLFTGGAEAAISISDYSAMGSDCGGVSSSSLSFSTPIGVQYRIAGISLNDVYDCDGEYNTHQRSAVRTFDHVATDWNHPFHFQTSVEVHERWRSDESGCIGGISDLQPSGATCAPPLWPGGLAPDIEKLASFVTVSTSAAISYFGVNELNHQTVGGDIRRYPSVGSALAGFAYSQVEGESPAATVTVTSSSLPQSMELNVRALNKQQTTVNVPVPHASFIYVGGVRQPGVFAALSGSPSPRTFKNPSTPALRNLVTAGADVVVPVPPLTGGWNNLTQSGPSLYEATCEVQESTSCPREVLHYGPFSAELNGVGLYRAPIPSWALAPGSVVVGEIVTHEIVPAFPPYDSAMGPNRWAMQVAARLGRIVKRQPVYAQGGGTPCVPPALTVTSAMTVKRGVWYRVAPVVVSTPIDEPIVVQMRTGGGLLQTNASVAGVAVLGSGSTDVRLQGLRSAVQAALSQRIVWYWNAEPTAANDAISISAWRTGSPDCAVTKVLGVTIVDQNLLNIDFGVTGNSYGWSDKTGPAAVGFTTGDVWEAISHYYNSGLAWFDGSPSGASVSLNNSATQAATPVGSFYHTDAMMNDFNIRADNTPLGATVSQLPAGTYDVYVYAHRGTVNGNSRVTLRRNGTTLGTATTTPEAIGSAEAWNEGRQYVLFRNVTLGAGQSLEVLSAGPNGTGSGCLNGMQLLRK